jgi:cytochrome c553
MKILSTVVMATALIASTHAFAGDPARGKTIFAAKGCIGCHGAGGVSTNKAYPTLKGRTEAFVKENLTNFRSGKRKNPTMNAMAASLKDDEIADLAAYIGSLSN